ncbi:hypothetical protein B9Z19DRAFT_1091680 [Tuber borchii]|uniref:Uncharacterized protein n=1 Tax=Tuber borchii TaxID=42251 RepID=A0A2T6ZHG9_TUBBO|nr:hypothetical protein B9Z19DRAFT_1091680 [Tuber borchii]
MESARMGMSFRRWTDGMHNDPPSEDYVAPWKMLVWRRPFGSGQAGWRRTPL